MIDPDAPVTGPDAAAYLGVAPATIRTWAYRGYLDATGERVHLTPVDHDGPRGAARYRWRDVARAERDTRRNPRSPGRPTTPGSARTPQIPHLAMHTI